MKTLMFVLALAACSGTPKATTSDPGKAPPIAEAADKDDCQTDDDCALVDACCGCNAGGRKVGIRADALPAYEKGRAARCGAAQCPAMMSEHPSCNAEAVCKKNHCRAQPHMNQAPSSPLPPAEPSKP